MKKMFFAAAILIAAFSASAQEKQPLTFSLGVHGTLPVGDFSDGWSFGFGASAQAEYKTMESLGFTGSVGYLSFSGKTVSGFKIPSVSQVPVLVGAKYYFNDMVYASGQLGVSFFSGNSNSTSAFTYAPGIGSKLGSNFDATLRYLAASKNGSTLSSIDLRIAYNF